MKKFIKWLLERPFIKGFMRFYMASESDITSIAVAYYLLISILPLLLIAANILPYFKIRPTQILLTLREVLPASMYRIVLQVISSVLTKPSTGLLSFSIISALWVSSQCIAYLQRAFNKSYGVEKERGIIWSRIFSVLISFALQGLFGLSLLLTMFGRMIIRSVYQFFEFDESLYIRLLTITGPSVYLLLFLTLLMLYYTLPNIKIPKFRYV
ncbi:YihY/virulence factor BrkB family protein, partial [Streptococcus rubneri]